MDYVWVVCIESEVPKVFASANAAYEYVYRYIEDDDFIANFRKQYLKELQTSFEEDPNGFYYSQGSIDRVEITY